MGKESNDIDICAEGIELEKLQSILSKEEVDSSQEQSKKINSVSRQIKSNPEKYKFINTLTIKILGFSIEIAPLRSVPGLQKVSSFNFFKKELNSFFQAWYCRKRCFWERLNNKLIIF